MNLIEVAAPVGGGIVGWAGMKAFLSRDRGPVKRHHRRQFAGKFAAEYAGMSNAQLAWNREWYEKNCADIPWLQQLRIEAITAEEERRGHREANTDSDRGTGTNTSTVAASKDAEPDAGEGASVSETPDLVDPIVGWRCWRATDDGNLSALNAGTYGPMIWMPREARPMHCAAFSGYPFSMRPSETHARPAENCSCGYYAAKLLAKCQWPESNYAYGRVAMWGKVIEHEGGYRAEYAYPIEVVLVPKRGESHYNGNVTELPAWSPEQAENIRLRMETMYGIPVSVGSDEAMRDEWAAQYLDLPLPPQVVPLLAANP